jgi:hypothetical protein
MATDILEQLAKREVPPPPPDLDKRIRRRLNAALLTDHLFEFAVRAIPLSMATMAAALAHAIEYTFSGRTRGGQDEKPRMDP